MRRRWYCALFLSGAVICENSTAPLDQAPSQCRETPLPHFLCCIPILYLANVPHVTAENLSRMPGWKFLSHLSPSIMEDQKWFFLFWPTSATLFIVTRTKKLQKYLENKWLLYLGHVSYGLFLVHGPILWTLGTLLYRQCNMFGPYSRRQHDHESSKVEGGYFCSGVIGLEFGFLCSQLLLLPLSLGTAQLATNYIIEPISSRSLRLYRYLII